MNTNAEARRFTSAAARVFCARADMRLEARDAAVLTHSRERAADAEPARPTEVKHAD